MNDQDCLERAMFTASESYSHSAYIFEDYGCAESGARTEKVISNLMAAIKADIITPTTKAELEQAEADHARAKAEIERSAGTTMPLDTFLPHAAERYRALLGNLRKTLQRDVAQARQYLKTLVGTVRLLPQGKVLFAELRHSTEGLISMASGTSHNIGLVAGARYCSNITAGENSLNIELVAGTCNQFYLLFAVQGLRPRVHPVSGTTAG